MDEMVLCIHLHLLVGMEDTEKAYHGKFLTFEQESIKAKLDNHSVRQDLRKGSLQFDIHNDLLPSDTTFSVYRIAAPRLLLLLTVSLHLQPLHTKYILVQTLDDAGAVNRSGQA